MQTNLAVFSVEFFQKFTYGNTKLFKIIIFHLKNVYKLNFVPKLTNRIIDMITVQNSLSDDSVIL